MYFILRFITFITHKILNFQMLYIVLTISFYYP